jgi:hypothetical protein
VGSLALIEANNYDTFTLGSQNLRLKVIIIELGSHGKFSLFRY